MGRSFQNDSGVIPKTGECAFFVVLKKTINMDKKIAVLAGDGIGPEVVAESIKVMEAVGKRFGHRFSFEEGLVGAVGIEQVGDPFPEESYQLCAQADAVLFGAVGDPKYDNDPSAKVRPEQGLLAMRKKLGLFANIRPVKSYPILEHASPIKKEIISGTDFVVYRELTGGFYFGTPRGRSEDGRAAFDTGSYSVEEISRIAELAFEAAKIRRNKVTLVDKANVLATSRLWRETVTRFAAEKYPEVAFETMFVDNAAMQLILNPKGFDVILTANLFGDIITDEASVITGSLGMLPSASVGAAVGVFEPIHGSFPQAAGKQIANPLASILSAAMLLETGLGMVAEAQAVRQAVESALAEKAVTKDIDPDSNIKTAEVGDFVAKQI